jgi:hypothetical protein
MLELHSLFLSCLEECEDGFCRRSPAQPVTHHKMLSILRRIRDGIRPTEDTYPNEKFLLNARDRYRRSLKSGNRMPLMAEEEEEVVLQKPGTKKRTSDSEGLLIRASKRGRSGRGKANKTHV